MNRVIYFDNENQKRDRCEGNIYRKFLDYAFDRTDFFMLVYVNYQGKGYSKKMKLFQTALRPYQVKIRRNPSWPGVLNTFSPQTTYKIIFYKTKLKPKIK